MVKSKAVSNSSSFAIQDVAKITAIVTNNLTVYSKAGSADSTKDKFIRYFNDESYRDSFKDVEVTYTVEELLNSVKEVYSNPKNDFEYTIFGIMFWENGEFHSMIDAKAIGIAIYAFVGAKKALERKVEEQKIAAESKSEYVGVIGNRQQFELTYDKTIWFEDGGIHFFHDDNENIFRWSTAKALPYRVGDRFVITGTIKDHREYKGIKQTYINRCKY